MYHANWLKLRHVHSSNGWEITKHCWKLPSLCLNLAIVQWIMLLRSLRTVSIMSCPVVIHQFHLVRQPLILYTVCQRHCIYLSAWMLFWRELAVTKFCSTPITPDVLSRRICLNFKSGLELRQFCAELGWTVVGKIEVSSAIRPWRYVYLGKVI